MSTSILPVKAGAKDCIRIGADKQTTSCSPSLVMGLLTEKTGPNSTEYYEREMATACLLYNFSWDRRMQHNFPVHIKLSLLGQWYIVISKNIKYYLLK